MKPKAFEPDAEHMALLQKVIADTADESEKARFANIHEKRSRDILEMPEDELFSVKKVTIELPGKAQIDPSVACDLCKEPTMAAKLVKTPEGKKICRGCQTEIR